MALSWSNAATARDDSAALAFIAHLPGAPQAHVQAHVIDIRDLPSCTAASLPRSRCLPVDHFVDPTGKIIDFHALRWLLGTVGLSGGESVLVIGATPQDVRTVGALLYLAGQTHVMMLDSSFEAPPGAPGGTERSLSREKVFTAPMRDAHLVAEREPATATHTQLDRFAQAVGRGAEDARLYWR